MVPEMAFSWPKIYLAGGVTTMRTTGAVEPSTDINIKRAIDRGDLAGPHMDVTGPYLEGATSPFVQMQRLDGPAAARRAVEFWADQGATSFKAYMNIMRAERSAILEFFTKVDGLKVQGIDMIAWGTGGRVTEFTVMVARSRRSMR